MKTIGVILLMVGMVFSPLLHAQTILTSSQVVAAAAAVSQTEPLAADNVCPIGLFYSALNPTNPPVPCNFNDLPAWDLGNGTYLLDDVDYSSQTQTHSSMRAMDDGGPPSPGGGGSGDGSTNTFSYTFETNGLWLEITGITNDIISLNLNNATNQVYEVWSADSLTKATWNIEQEVWPTNQTSMPFTVAMDGRTNGLFFYARDWTGITENGNTTPAWWFYYYFGTTALSDTNLDPAGNTLLSDYETGMNPNVIFFTPVFPSLMANNSNVTAEIAMVAGVPSSMACLVGNTNFSAAPWQPWSSNITVALGPTNGIYDVWIGVAGFSTHSQTWTEKWLPFYQAPLNLVVTNLVSDVVTQSSVQLQGYSPAPLSGLTFDVSNSVSVATNLSGSVAGGYYNTNLLVYTSNYFQFNNILLSPGANKITLHARDLDGNSFSTNLTLTYTLDTNPPVLSLVWPSDSLAVSGSSLTIQARVNDPTTVVQASANGVAVAGTVEQSGAVWLPGVALAAGTNHITITATNVAGKVSAMELDVIQSTVGLTINPIETNQLGEGQITATGAISDPTDEVWANGVQATVNGDGTWEAANVIVSSTGTAVIVAQAGPSAGDIVAAQTFSEPQPAQVTLESTFWDYQFNDYSTGCGWSAGDAFTSQDDSTLAWNNSSGGAQNWWQYGFGGDGPYDNEYYEGISASSPPSPWVEANDLAFVSQPSCGSNFAVGPIVASSQLVIMPPGQTQAGTTNLYLVSASAMEYSDPQNIVYDIGGDTPLPPPWLQIQGEPLTSDITTNDDGSIWGSTLVSFPAGLPATVTPVATQVYSNNIYSVNATAQPISLAIATMVGAQTNSILLDPVQTKATFCVGQQIAFVPVFSPPLPPNITNIVYNWTLPDPANFVNSSTTNSAGCPLYTNDPTRLGNPTNICWYINGTGGTVTVGANVLLPNGKSVTLAAIGKFAIYRPQIVEFVPPLEDPIAVLDSGYLQLDRACPQAGSAVQAE